MGWTQKQLLEENTTEFIAEIIANKEKKYKEIKYGTR
jgi:hypothetical protein